MVMKVAVGEALLGRSPTSIPVAVDGVGNTTRGVWHVFPYRLEIMVRPPIPAWEACAAAVAAACEAVRDLAFFYLSAGQHRRPVFVGQYVCERR